MKLTFFFLILFTISSCGNQARRRGTNLSGIEGDSEVSETEDEAPKSKAADRAPKGEIELGITGDSAGKVIIDEDAEGETEQVKVESNEPEDLDVAVKKKAKVDCKKFPKHKDCIKKTDAPDGDDSDLIINKDTPEAPE